MAVMSCDGRLVLPHNSAFPNFQRISTWLIPIVGTMICSASVSSAPSLGDHTQSHCGSLCMCRQSRAALPLSRPLFLSARSSWRLLLRTRGGGGAEEDYSEREEGGSAGRRIAKKPEDSEEEDLEQQNSPWTMSREDTLGLIQELEREARSREEGEEGDIPGLKKAFEGSLIVGQACERESEDQGRTAREWVVPEDCSTIQEALAQAGYDDTVAVQGRRYQLGQGVVVPAAMRIGMTSWAEEERDLPAAKLVGRWLLSEGSEGSFETVTLGAHGLDSQGEACITVLGGPWLFDASSLQVYSSPSDTPWGGVVLMAAGLAEVRLHRCDAGGVWGAGLCGDVVLMLESAALSAHRSFFHAARFAAFRCGGEATVECSGCSFTDASYALGLGGACNVTVRKSRFRRLVHGAFTLLDPELDPDGQKPALHVLGCRFFVPVWYGSEQDVVETDESNYEFEEEEEMDGGEESEGEGGEGEGDMAALLAEAERRQLEGEERGAMEEGGGGGEMGDDSGEDGGGGGGFGRQEIAELLRAAQQSDEDDEVQ